MKITKKILAVVLSLTLTAILAACGGGAESTTPDHTFSLGIDSPKDTVTYFYAKTLADELNTLSGGKMVINIYTDGTLGGDVALLEGVNDGSVHLAIQTTAPQVNFIPELAVFDLPMVYPTIEEFRQVFDNDAFMEQIAGYYDANGYKLLGYADQTFRVMSSNIKIENMSDFNGVKIRTMENPNHMEFWRALGASPTPMAFSELYTGLQQGTVSAQENPYAVIHANKFFEVQDYVIQTNHLPHILSLIMNPETYNSLSNEERAILNQAVENATKAARQEADRYESEKIAEIRAENTEIIPVSDELYQEMRAAAQPVYDDITAKVGQDLVNAYIGA